MPFSGLQSLMIKIGHGGLERVSNLEKDPNDNSFYSLHCFPTYNEVLLVKVPFSGLQGLIYSDDNRIILMKDREEKCMQIEPN